MSLFSGFLQPFHRFGFVLFYTITKAQHVLCISKPLFCRLTIPFHGHDFITYEIEMQWGKKTITNHKLIKWVFYLVKPFFCFLLVLFNSSASRIAHSETKLRYDTALLRYRAIPPHLRLAVPLHSTVFFQFIPGDQLTFCTLMPLFRCLVIPLQRFCFVRFYTITKGVARTKPVLCVSLPLFRCLVILFRRHAIPSYRFDLVRFHAVAIGVATAKPVLCVSIPPVPPPCDISSS